MRHLLIALLFCFLVAPASSWAAASIASQATTIDDTGLSAPITMPSGIVAGNLLLALCGHNDDAGAQTGGSDWTRLVLADNGTEVGLTAFAKIAAGSDTLTLAIPNNNDVVCITYRIINHGVSNVSVDLMMGTAATGNSTTPDPPNVAHGGPQDYLVLEHFMANTAVQSGTYWSANYAAAGQDETGPGLLVGVGQRAVENTAENPGTMSIGASVNWVAQTYSIPPTLPTFYAQLTAPFTASDGADIGAAFDSGYTGQTNAQIVSNAVQGTSTVLESVETASTTLADTQMADLDITGWPASVGSRIASVFLRCTAPATFTCYRFVATDDFGTLIQEITTGTSAALATDATGITWAAGDALRGIAIGSRITFQRKPSGGAFATILTAVDATLTSGRAGLNVTTSLAVTDVIVDNFVAYDTTAPAGGAAATMSGINPAILGGF